MLITLKIVHYLSLMAGGGSSIATLILQRSLARTGHVGPPPPAIAMATRMMGILGLTAILLLWGTGLVMLMQNYVGADLGIWFAVKLLAATLIFGISATMNVMAARAARTGVPPNPALMKHLASAIRILLLIAIITAVIVFSA